jgi:hypothetical protein
MKAKALLIFVYERGTLSNSSNGGITKHHKEVLVLCDEGPFTVDLDDPPENLVKVVTRNIFGQEYKHLEPYKTPEPGKVGWMDGGSFGYGYDSRFRRISKYPLPIHDRQEAQAAYDAMSR